MRDLPPGWATDVAVLRHSGSVVEDRGDHLVVRTPQNPDYYWGNCILVLDERTVGDADRWIGVFDAAHPDAGMGVRRPDQGARRRLGLDGAGGRDRRRRRADVACSSRGRRRWPTATPCGVSPATTGSRSWRQRSRTTNSPARTTRCTTSGTPAPRPTCGAGSPTPTSPPSSGRSPTASSRPASASSCAGRPPATSRSARTPAIAAVGSPAHLLGVAAAWSAGKGCDRWVIITEAGNPAGRLYRSVGFAPDVSNARAYRPPAR